MKRISYEYLLFWIQIAIITFFVLLLSAFYFKISDSNFLENGLYSENVKGFELQDEKQEVLTDLLSKCDKEISVFRFISDDNHLKRGYYAKGEAVFPFSSYISEGRFFDGTDFEEKRKVAVVGSEAEDSLFEENGRRYYGYDGNKYEVIGIFRETKTDLDKVVYLNLLSLSEAQTNDGIYFIDGPNEEKNMKCVNEVLSSDVGAKEVHYENKQEDMNIIHKIKFILAIVAAFCNLVMISIYFAGKQKYKIAVMKLCGLRDLEIAFGYLKKLTAVVVLAFLSGIGLLLLCRNAAFVSFEQIGIRSYLAAGVIICFAAALIICQLVRTLRRTDISSSLKGGA